MKDKSFAEKPAESGKKSVVGLGYWDHKNPHVLSGLKTITVNKIISRGKSPSLGVKKGVVSNIEQTINSILAAIEDTEQNCKEGNLKLSHVVVGIAGQHIRSMQTSDSYTRKNREEEISQADITTFINNMYDLVINPGEEIITVILKNIMLMESRG